MLGGVMGRWASAAGSRECLASASARLETIRSMLQKDLVRKTMLVALLAMACSKQAPTTPESLSAAAAVAIPEKDAYERNMRQFATAVCQKELMNTGASLDEKLAATYYDGQRVMLQIADYLGDASFKTCANAARSTYRDAYVMRPEVMGGVPGYWIFPTGLFLDFKATGDQKSKDAVVAMSRRGAFCAVSGADSSPRTALSREIAYCGLTYILSEQMGEPKSPRRDELFNYMFGHLRAWIDVSPLSRVANPFDESPRCAGKYYVQPFMVGLTLHSLIQLHSYTGDPRVPAAVKEAVDWLWEKHWVAADQSFVYENCVDAPGGAYPKQPGAPDLNLLIAPAFAWVFKQTGEDKYRERGDAIFAGGVQRAWLDGAKQFNQNYMWSPDYIRWRGGAPSAGH